MGFKRVSCRAGFAIAVCLVGSLAIAPGAWARAARAPGEPAQTGQAAAAPRTADSSAAQALSPAERALRARVEQFWSLWVANQRVKALDLVAPDSRDAFLGEPMPPVNSFHFDKIVEQDKPGLAVVYVHTVRPSPTPQFPVPIESFSATVWKQIDGEWYLTKKDVVTVPGPFGPQKLNGDQADAAAGQQQLQQMINEKSKQLDMKKIQEYLKTHDRVVSTSPNIQVRFEGDDQSQNPKGTTAPTPQTNGKKPAPIPCPPAAGDKTSACPPH